MMNPMTKVRASLQIQDCVCYAIKTLSSSPTLSIPVGMSHPLARYIAYDTFSQTIELL